MFLRGLPVMTYVLLEPVERRSEEDAVASVDDGLCCKEVACSSEKGLKVLGSGLSVEPVLELEAIEDSISDYTILKGIT